jgi:hypothetical protein
MLPTDRPDRALRLVTSAPAAGPVEPTRPSGSVLDGPAADPATEAGGPWALALVTERIAEALHEAAMLQSGLPHADRRPMAELPIGVRETYRQAAAIAVRRLDPAAHYVGLGEMADLLATPQTVLSPERLLDAYHGGLLDPAIVLLRGGRR